MNRLDEDLYSRVGTFTDSPTELPPRGPNETMANWVVGFTCLLFAFAVGGTAIASVFAPTDEDARPRELRGTFSA
ncbi:MAG: hypothetical protein AAFR41_00915 [Pseudomonadota bacterium]